MRQLELVMRSMAHCVLCLRLSTLMKVLQLHFSGPAASVGHALVQGTWVPRAMQSWWVHTLMDAGNGGNASGAVTVCASTRPSAFATDTRSVPRDRVLSSAMRWASGIKIIGHCDMLLQLRQNRELGVESAYQVTHTAGTCQPPITLPQKPCHRVLHQQQTGFVA